MTKLEWCKMNAPEALKSSSDEELLECMDSVWTAYCSKLPTEIFKPYMTSDDKWQIVLKMPSWLSHGSTYIKLIDKGIDVSPFYSESYRHKSASYMAFLIEFVAAGVDLSTATKVVDHCSKNCASSEHYVESAKLGLDWTRVDVEQIDWLTLRAVNEMLREGSWDYSLLPFVYSRSQVWGLRGAKAILTAVGDISWLSPKSDDYALKELGKIIEKLGYLPDCLKLEVIDQEDIEFFKLYGRSAEHRDVMSKVKSPDLRLLAVAHPEHLEEIIEFDKKCPKPVVSEVWERSLSYGYTSSEFSKLSLEERCKAYYDAMLNLYTAYEATTPEELINKLSNSW